MTKLHTEIISFNDKVALKKHLEQQFSKPLPGRVSHEKMIPTFPLKAFEYFSSSDNLKQAAVLILLYEDNSKIKTVLIERTPDPGPHSGQIAFPGGRRETYDKDLIDTAIREAEEEVGVKIERENVIGSLTPVQIPVSGYSVLPVLATIDQKPTFTPCQDEVNKIFEVELTGFLSSFTNKEIVARGYDISAPCFMIGETVVWGATAMVLNELKEILN